jgi:hypothetical protein
MPRSLLTSLAAGLLAAAALSSCKTVASRPVVIGDSPVAYQLVSDIVDEDSLEYTVKFRNVGQQIVSFDYTIADDPNVPHVDCLGPNSGLVENLYPGAEAIVKNPLASKRVSVQLGRLTVGKKTPEELARAYKPGTLTAPATAPALDLLPTLEGVSPPSE